MALTYELISSYTVGSGGASTITFSSIPGTYTDLLLETSLRKTTSGLTDLGLRINSVTSGYSFKSFGGTGSSVTNGNFSGMSFYYGEDAVQGSDSTSNVFGSINIYIPNYTSSNGKKFLMDAATENNATAAYNRLSIGYNSTSSAITSILIQPGSGGNTFAQYSTAYLYGIKNS